MFGAFQWTPCYILHTIILVLHKMTFMLYIMYTTIILVLHKIKFMLYIMYTIILVILHKMKFIIETRTARFSVFDFFHSIFRQKFEGGRNIAT
jgi:hypothetical protein